MRRIIKEIHQQPEHIRKVFMWLCAIIVFSGVVVAGAKQTQRRIVALVNPENVQENSAVAKGTSPFSALFSYFGELKADIGSLFQPSVQEVKRAFDQQVGKDGRFFPVSRDKTISPK